MGRNGFHQNGTSNGTGGKGGPRLGLGRQYLDALLQGGEATAKNLAEAEQFCRNVIDDADSTTRDKNNASRTLTTIAKIKADAAVNTDKMDRLDGGDPTERLEHVSPEDVARTQELARRITGGADVR